MHQMNIPQYILRTLALMTEAHVTGNFDCLKVATLLNNDMMAITRDVNEKQTLQSFLSFIRQKESLFMEMRVQYLLCKGIGDGDDGTATSTAMDNPSVSVEDGRVILDELIDSIENLSVPVEPGLRMGGGSGFGEVIESMDSFDECWESTEIPHIESIIARITESPGTQTESTATDDIAYFQSIVARMAKPPNTFEPSVSMFGFTRDQSFYARIMEGPKTQDQPLKSADSDSDLDEVWNASDIPHLESIIGRIMGSDLTMEEPSAIDDIVYFRSIITRIMERPRTLEKPSDTKEFLDFQSAFAGSIEYPASPNKSPESTDGDSEVDESWVLDDIPDLMTIIALHNVWTKFTGVSAEDDIVYFQSVIRRMMGQLTLGEPTDHASLMASVARIRKLVGVTSESSDTADEVVDSDSAIDYIMGKERTPDDPEDVAYFQSIAPRIMKSRAGETELSDPADHDARTELSDAAEHDTNPDSAIDHIKRRERALDDPEDLAYFQSIVDRIIKPRSSQTELSEEANDDTVPDSTIDYIMGRERTPYDPEDVAYFQSIADRIIKSRADQTELSDAADHGIDPDSAPLAIVDRDDRTLKDTKNVANPQSLDRRIMDFLKTRDSSPNLIDGEARLISDAALVEESKILRENKSSDGIDEFTRLESDITRMEEIVGAVHYAGNKKSTTYSLAQLLHDRYLRRGGLNDLDRAIEGGEEALTLCPPGHPGRPAMLTLVASNYTARYSVRWCEDDMDKVVKIAKEMAAVPKFQPVALSHLSQCILSRYQQFGVLGDLEKAIKASEEALRLTPHNPHERVSRLGDLAQCLLWSFERLGKKEDLERGILLYEDAIAATPDTDRNRAAMMSNLGSLYNSKFDQTGAAEDISKAIELTEHAIKVTPLHYLSHGAFLGTSSSIYAQRFARYGKIEDIDQAILLCEQARAAYPENYSGSAAVSCNLGILYNMRFTRLGALDDLERSIRACQAAVAATPENHPHRQTVMSALGSSFASKFKRFQDMEASERATEADEAALAATPAGHPARASVLFHLSIKRTAKYWKSDDIGDLEKAIETCQQALDACSEQGSKRGGILSHLGKLHSLKWPVAMDMEGRARAETMSEEAVAATQLDDPDRATRLIKLSLQISKAPQMMRRSKIMSSLLENKNKRETLNSGILSNDPNTIKRLEALPNILQEIHDRIAVTTKDNGVADYELFDMEKLITQILGELWVEANAETAADNLKVLPPSLFSAPTLPDNGTGVETGTGGCRREVRLRAGPVARSLAVR